MFCKSKTCQNPNLELWSNLLGVRAIGTVTTEENAKIALDAGAHDVILYTQKVKRSEFPGLRCASFRLLSQQILSLMLP